MKLIPKPKNKLTMVQYCLIFLTKYLLSNVMQHVSVIFVIFHIVFTKYMHVFHVFPMFRYSSMRFGWNSLNRNLICFPCFCNIISELINSAYMLWCWAYSVSTFEAISAISGNNEPNSSYICIKESLRLL